jgi:hypothetical protein
VIHKRVQGALGGSTRVQGHLEVNFPVVPIQQPLRGAQHGRHQRQLPRRSPCSRLETCGFGSEN